MLPQTEGKINFVLLGIANIISVTVILSTLDYF